MLSRLALISGLKVIERRVIEAVERSQHQQPTLVRMRSFEVQKREPILRTCVYSRYASLKAKAFKWFCRSQATSGLAVDFRERHQNNSFCRRKGAATNLGCPANKNHHILDLENYCSLQIGLLLGPETCRSQDLRFC